MNRETVHTAKAPKAIGPYSQAVKAGGFLFCSGQVALDADSGEIVSGGVEVQAEKVLNNLTAVLEAGGSSWDRVVKTTIYLADMADFAVVNEVYARFAGDSLPARATVAVSGLPKNVRVEIDAIALV